MLSLANLTIASIFSQDKSFSKPMRSIEQNLALNPTFGTAIASISRPGYSATNSEAHGSAFSCQNQISWRGPGGTNMRWRRK